MNSSASAGNIQASLSQRQLLKQHISVLQTQEREKLNLTAALHLERIRFQSLSSSSDEVIQNLLKQGIQTLRSKLATCVEMINEILEEIRLEIIENEE